MGLRLPAVTLKDTMFSSGATCYRSGATVGSETGVSTKVVRNCFGILWKLVPGDNYTNSLTQTLTDGP